MIKCLSIMVRERPQSQGAISGGHHRNRRLKKFREDVGYQALFAMSDAGLHEPSKAPIKMELGFYFARPSTVNESDMFPMHGHLPDLSHLQRAVEDALEGIVYVNDRQVVDCRSIKWYGTPERVEIMVWLAEEVQ
jgi:Holliday junction resolvase RusA-like endonuclease